MNLSANQMDPKNAPEAKGMADELEEWVPLSVREAPQAREGPDELWPYVWMNFVSMILLFSALAIACCRGGAQSCH